MSILGTQMRITGVPKQLTFKILGGQGHFHIWPPRRGCAQPVPRSSEPVSIENPPSRKRGGHQKKTLSQPRNSQLKLFMFGKIGLPRLLEVLKKNTAVHFEEKAQHFRIFFWYSLPSFQKCALAALPVAGTWLDQSRWGPKCAHLPGAKCCPDVDPHWSTHPGTIFAMDASYADGIPKKIPWICEILVAKELWGSAAHE